MDSHIEEPRGKKWIIGLHGNNHTSDNWSYKLLLHIWFQIFLLKLISLLTWIIIINFIINSNSLFTLKITFILLLSPLRFPIISTSLASSYFFSQYSIYQDKWKSAYGLSVLFYCPSFFSPAPTHCFYHSKLIDQIL